MSPARCVLPKYLWQRVYGVQLYKPGSGRHEIQSSTLHPRHVRHWLTLTSWKKLYQMAAAASTVPATVFDRSRWTPWRCDFSVILCFGAWKGIEVCEMGLWGWKLSKNWKIVRLFCLIRSVRVWEMMWRCLCEWLIVGALIRSYSCYSRLVYDLLMIEKKILSHLLHGAS